MRQYSRHIYDREEVCFCIRMLKPLKTEKEEEKLKDKHRKDLEFTAPHPNHEKNITSLLHSGRKAERESQQVSTIGEYNNSGIKPIDRISHKTNNIYTLKLAKARKEEKEIRFKCPGSMSYDVMMNDVIVTGTNNDVTRGHVNKLIARKRYTLMKHSLAQLKRFRNNLLSITSQIFTKMVLIIAITITILGGMLNVTWPEGKSVIGTSSCSSCFSELAKHRTHIFAEPTFARDVFGWKTFYAYIFPSADFWAS